jgi:hypothetical protein
VHYALADALGDSDHTRSKQIAVGALWGLYEGMPLNGATPEVRGVVVADDEAGTHQLTMMINSRKRVRLPHRAVLQQHDYRVDKLANAGRSQVVSLRLVHVIHQPVARAEDVLEEPPGVACDIGLEAEELYRGLPAEVHMAMRQTNPARKSRGRESSLLKRFQGRRP